MITMTPRALFHLLWNGSKAVDVVLAAFELGILARLDAGSVSVGVIANDLGLVPGRVYKLLDCLESLGLVERTHDADDIVGTVYRAPEPLCAAVAAALGPEAIERDRDRHPWRTIHGVLPSVLRGETGVGPDVFPWPPVTVEDNASFEQSMSAGCAPILESFVAAGALLFGERPCRLLDVGGGDGTLARGLLATHPNLVADVFNLPNVRPLFEAKAAGAAGRLGFVAGDFHTEPLPRGYDVMSFVRVLHDWPDIVAKRLLRAAHDALPPGGRIVISEEMRTPERLAVQFFWSYFLIGLDSCVSRLRPVEFYVAALPEIGFGDVRVIPGAFDIVTAVRRVPLATVCQ